MDMRFETWNVRSLCKAGSVRTVASELAKYDLAVVAVYEVRWVKNGSQPGDNYTFLYRNRNANHHFGTSLFIHKGIISAVKRVEFVSDKMLSVTLKRSLV
jgi:hypothetical protein